MEVPTKNKVIFIFLCVLLVIAAILGVLVGSVIFKRESYLKYANYWCDTKWTCCNEDKCDATKSIQDEQGKLLKIDETAIYYPVDMIREGSAYHQNCVLPVRNAMLNYAGSTGTALGFNLQEIFGFEPSGSSTAPSVWGPGCTGPGGATGTKCADPAYNPQVHPLCDYVPPDAFSGLAGYSEMKPSTYVSNGYVLPTNKNIPGTNKKWNQGNNVVTSKGNFGSLPSTSPVYQQLTGTGWSSSTNSSSWISTLQGPAGSNGKATNANLYNNLLRPDLVTENYPNKT